MAEVMQQDVVWVRFPFSDMENAKFRPVVIISNNAYNKSSHDIVACGITSNLDAKDYSILIDESNLYSGRLPVKSRIRADKIMQLEKRIIEKPFAKLDNKTFKRLTKEMAKLFKRSDAR